MVLRNRFDMASRHWGMGRSAPFRVHRNKGGQTRGVATQGSTVPQRPDPSPI